MYRAWPKTKGIPSWVHRSASQVPGEEACDADDDILAIGRNRLETRLGCCPHIPVEYDLSILVYNTARHRPGVQVDATVKLGRLGVESPEVSSSSEGCVPNASSPTVVCRGGGLKKYRTPAAGCLQPPLLRRSGFRQRL